MKIILTASSVAMIAAGIYGAADFGNDLRNGNEIQYEQDEITVASSRNALPEVSGFVRPLRTEITTPVNSAPSEKVVLSAPVKKKITNPVPTITAPEKQTPEAGTNVSAELPSPTVLEEFTVDSVPVEPKEVVLDEQPEIRREYFSRGSFKKHKVKRKPKS